MVEAVSVSESRIEKSLQQAAPANQVQKMGQSLAHLIEQLNKLLPVHQREAAATRATTEKLLQEHIKRELAAFEVLSRFLDEKGKGSLLASITKALENREGDHEHQDPRGRQRDLRQCRQQRRPGQLPAARGFETAAAGVGAGAFL